MHTINSFRRGFGPEEASEKDRSLNLPPTESCTSVITSMDVFSRFLSAYPTIKCVEATVGRCITDILSRHAHLPIRIATYEGSHFRAETIRDTSSILGVDIYHATTRHAKIIGILENANTSLKINLKVQIG